MSDTFDHQVLSRHAYGLVDPLMADTLPEGIVALPLVPPVLEESAHLMPRLVRLRGLSTAQQEQLLSALHSAHADGEQPPMSLFIASEAGDDAFIRHWNGMQVAAPQHDLKFWLRLHDPRVLHQLLRIANAEQRRRLIGPAVFMTYWIDGEWITAHADDASVPAATAYNSGSTLPFGGATRWDWPRVERIGMVNRALTGAGVQGAANLTRQGARAEQLLEQAVQRHDLTDPADIIAFAARGLNCLPDFDRHPEIARAIPARAAADDDSNLADRFALLDEQVWQQLHHASRAAQGST